MAKRRAEDCLLFESPSKRCCARWSRVDVPLDGMAAASRSVSPPALLALLESRCRKRPRYFEDPEGQAEAKTPPHGKEAHCDIGRHADVATTMHTTGSLQERRGSSGLDSNPPKRPRPDSKCSETDIHEHSEEEDKEKNTDDSIYNSFQYWRVPLPELDLSLLEETSHDPQTKENLKLKDSSSDAMET